MDSVVFFRWTQNWDIPFIETFLVRRRTKDKDERGRETADISVGGDESTNIVSLDKMSYSATN